MARPGPGTHGPVNMKALNKDVVMRILSYLRAYQWQMIAVVICIIVSAMTSVMGMTFLETIIDDRIKPMLLSSNPDFPKEPSLVESKDIGKIMNQMKGWERCKSMRVVGMYGKQRCWQKKEEE